MQVPYIFELEQPLLGSFARANERGKQDIELEQE